MALTIPSAPMTQFAWQIGKAPFPAAEREPLREGRGVLLALRPRGGSA